MALLILLLDVIFYCIVGYLLTLLLSDCVNSKQNTREISCLKLEIDRLREELDRRDYEAK